MFGELGREAGRGGLVASHFRINLMLMTDRGELVCSELR